MRKKIPFRPIRGSVTARSTGKPPMLHKEEVEALSSARSDIGKEYDKYYVKSKNTGKSIYDQYSKGVLKRDEDLLVQIIRDSVANNTSGSENLLEHGGGDGRYFPILFKSLTEATKSSNIEEMRVFVEEPSTTGLLIYKDKLLEAGFKKHRRGNDLRHLEGDQSGYAGPTFKHPDTGIEFRLINIGPKDSQDHIKKLVCIDNIKFDVITSMFGPLAHIIQKEARDAVLRRFTQTLKHDGSFVATVPAPERFKQWQSTFDNIRLIGWAPDLFSEPYTFAYPKFADVEDGREPSKLGKKDVLLPYSVFTSTYLINLLKNCNLKVTENGLQINFLNHDIIALLNPKNSAMNAQDAINSQALSDELNALLKDESAPLSVLDKLKDLEISDITIKFPYASMLKSLNLDTSISTHDEAFTALHNKLETLSNDKCKTAVRDLISKVFDANANYIQVVAKPSWEKKITTNKSHKEPSSFKKHAGQATNSQQSAMIRS